MKNEQKRVHSERGWLGKGIHRYKENEFEIVYILSTSFPIERICRMLNINRRSFYYWRERQLHPTAKMIKRWQDCELFMQYHIKYPSHGYRWLNAKIRLDMNIIFSDNYAHKRCKYNGIKSITRKKYRYTSNERPYIYPNLLIKDLNITTQLQVIVSDMTAFLAKATYYELTLYV